VKKSALQISTVLFAPYTTSRGIFLLLSQSALLI
jgi:hypothetical protein